MANYCGQCLGLVNGREAVLGDFDQFFERVCAGILPFFREDLCSPSVCEGHGCRVFVFMDWVGGFWFVHHTTAEHGAGTVPRPQQIPDPGPLTNDQLADLEELRGYDVAAIKECLDANLYAALVELGVPPQPPAT